MKDVAFKKLVQSVGYICAAIGNGYPAPASRGLALVLAYLAENPAAVDKLAITAKRIIEKRGQDEKAS